jgi:myo-inositol-1(or 4)-monophosphatase
MTDDQRHDNERYDAFGTFAVELARLAGERITRSLDTEIVIEYKDEGTSPLGPKDVVTNLDREIEEELAQRIRTAFPDHGIIGEEGTRDCPGGCEYVWLLDPIDGTQNFVNGLPIFSTSVGLVRQGRPVAGAIWGASSHRLRAGVYHAHLGSGLRFDGIEVTTARPSRGKRRGLGAMPHDEDQRVHLGTGEYSDHSLPWDRRHIGSGALEAAFLAAGILESAFNTGPRSWDIAAGALLVQEAGRGIWHQRGAEWLPLDVFAETPEAIAQWKFPVLMATSAAYARHRGIHDAVR